MIKPNKKKDGSTKTRIKNSNFNKIKRRYRLVVKKVGAVRKWKD